MRKEPKIGEVEYVERFDGKFAVYKYMEDPTVSQPDIDAPRYSDFVVCRWVQIDVISELPKAPAA
jgi:hypothetical protein